MRGRGSNNNNNNRKGPNPLTRSYESNGPDVKIRGTAQQIAEKYSTLGRDAQSSGDRVIAENYLQHAEHYNRVIMTAQAQQQQAQQNRENRDEDDQDDRDDGDGENARAGQDRGEKRMNGAGPQPVLEDTPSEGGHSQDEASEGRNVSRRRSRGQARDKEGADESGATGADASTSSDGNDEDAAPRKPRRTRRPRKEAKSEDDASSGETPSEGSQESVPEAAQ